MGKSKDRIDVLDISVDIVTQNQALDIIIESINEKTKLHIVTVNAEMIMLSKEDKAFKSILNSAGLVIPDGSGVIWALSRKGIKIKKLAGIELAESMIKDIDAKLFFFGGKEEIVKKACEKFQESTCKGKIIGYRNGYFTEKDEDNIINEINTLNPDILLVGLGVPRQEKWIAKNINKLNASVFIGVGGAFDVFSGNIKRAPAFMRSLHLEWLYRLYKEPWRWRRMLALPKFAGEVIKQR